HAEQGLFRDVENAYYVGCGTGIADALKLHGSLLTFDQAGTWIQKSWQIPSAMGPTFEKLVSAKSMNEGYHRLCGADSPEASSYPEVEAAAGKTLAVSWMDTVARTLAELISERMTTIHQGRAQATHRGDSYLGLERDHPFRGTSLQRVVIGQRLGQIYAAPQYCAVFADRLDQYLVALLAGLGDDAMRASYLPDGGLKPELVCASRLRAAPALGAAIAALQPRAV
ncbi:MAG: hypothetical protein GY842_12145, partial [bacterium]|nr:hypothetical protein [bacterium]